ncbi:T6SS immunity protein Tdi1 domain-containing protein [Promicromonospora iranensis]|uniref:T6SS immunity protein Tdi1 C-terminal domain-containing protein n=1 Tax=Promicromonospora iranensis TaxID=1105144 RepID=A0ABU2CNV5_9MICO|nr:T6SS immunity protein Tdi1 domain-containing protein [Promicromonospora iranensis]MDR7383004.1 hypothetical protein [Promicromonospora iranensis]
MKLLRTFPKVSFEFGLASWQWLGLREQTPRFATCFGDLFLESLDGWWFLDTVEGTLELRWTSAVTMYAELESAEGRATYLMDDLVRDARRRGIHLGEEDVYTFNPHPALGGELGVNGLGAMRFELAVNWVGQMHDQVLHGSGELNLPPMPDDGRHAGAPRVAAAWDAAWSDDETFDVPFEQYLATTTFAAVAAPGQNGGVQPYAAPAYDVQTYATESYEAPANPAQPAPRPPWPVQDGPAPLWSGPTETAQQWTEPNQAPEPATALDDHVAPYDSSYPAAEQHGTSTSDQQHGWPPPQQDWLPHGADPDSSGPDQQVPAGPTWNSPTWNGPTWGNPTWGSTTWGSQAPAVAAGGSQQQSSRADDPFTAWDDLWGKR